MQMRGKPEHSVQGNPGARGVRVGVVAHPGIGRTAIERALAEDAELTVVGFFADVETAARRVRPPDVWLCEGSLDTNVLDLASDPRPVIRFAYGARQSGGDAGFVALPNDRFELARAFEQLRSRAKSVGISARRARRTEANRPASIVPITGVGGVERLVIAITASSGGPAMVRQVLGGLPPDGPAVLLVQQIGGPHVQGLVRHLGRGIGYTVQLASPDQEVRPGHVYVAQPGRHLMIERHRTGYRLRCDDGPPVNHCRPSGDLLLSSMATAVGHFGIGVVMTGMGIDGADGLLALRLCGGATFAQNEATSTAWGMPRAAIAEGGAERVIALENIAPEILRACARAMPRRHS